MPGERQLNLFGESSPQGGHDSDLPPDVIQALEIVTGANPFVGTNPVSAMPDSALEKFQATMLKRHEMKHVKPENSNFEIHTLDLAVEADRKKLEEILNRISVVGSDLTFEQTPSQVLLDPNAPAGYRVITVVRVYKTKRVIDPAKDKPLYHQIDPASAQVPLGGASKTH